MNEIELKRARDEAVKRKGAYEEGLRQNAATMKELEVLLQSITPQMRETLHRLNVDISFIDNIEKERLQYDGNYLEDTINKLYDTAINLGKITNK